MSEGQPPKDSLEGEGPSLSHGSPRRGTAEQAGLRVLVHYQNAPQGMQILPGPLHLAAL